MLDEPIYFGNPHPKAKLGDRVACWLVVVDDGGSKRIVRRLGPVVGKFGKHSVLIQDEALIDIEDPFYAARDMLFKPAFGPSSVKLVKTTRKTRAKSKRTKSK